MDEVGFILDIKYLQFSRKLIDRSTECKRAPCTAGASCQTPLSIFGRVSCLSIEPPLTYAGEVLAPFGPLMPGYWLVRHGHCSLKAIGLVLGAEIKDKGVRQNRCRVWYDNNKKTYTNSYRVEESVLASSQLPKKKPSYGPSSHAPCPPSKY